MRSLWFGIAAVVALLSGSGTWSTLDPLSASRVGHAAHMVDGQLCVVGGYNVVAAVLSTEFYDPDVDLWRTGADLPSGRSSFASCVARGKLHVLGGMAGQVGPGGTGSYLQDQWIYDPNTDSWTSGPDLPSPRLGGAAVAHRGKIYLVGGMVATGVVSPNGQTGAYYNTDVDVLDVAAGTWSKADDFPREASEIQAVRVGRRMVVCGADDTETWIEVLDLTTGSWSSGTSAPTHRSGGALVAVGGAAVLIGGYDEDAAGGAQMTATIDVYLARRDRWRTSPHTLPTLRTRAAAAYRAREIYVVGGADGPMSVTDAVQQLTLTK